MRDSHLKDVDNAMDRACEELESLNKARTKHKLS